MEKSNMLLSQCSVLENNIMELIFLLVKVIVVENLIVIEGIKVRIFFDKLSCRYNLKITCCKKDWKVSVFSHFLFLFYFILITSNCFVFITNK